MQIIKGGGVIVSLPVDGAGSDIVEGACVMPGVTDETNRGVAIVASGAAADAIGIIRDLHDFSVDGDTTMESGATLVKHDIELFTPGCVVAAEMDLTATDLDVAGYDTSTGKITISSLEDDIDGGWVYVNGDPGAGQLDYAILSAAGEITCKGAAFATALTTDSDVFVMRPLFHQLLTLGSNADKIVTSAAAGSLPWRVLGIQMKYDGMENWEDLDMTKTYPTNLDDLHVKFRYLLSPANTLLNPTD